MDVYLPPTLAIFMGTSVQRDDTVSVFESVRHLSVLIRSDRTSGRSNLQMVSWDVAERTIDSISPSCRGELQAVMEQPFSSSMTDVCQKEVAKTLHLQSLGELPRKTKGGLDEVGKHTLLSDGGSRPELSLPRTNPATIVLSFVSCALVAFVGAGYYVSGRGRSIGRHPRHERRLHKKKHERLRERAKRRR